MRSNTLIATIFLFCCAFLLLGNPSYAGSRNVQVYELHYQTAAPLLPTVQALLAEGESVNEYNNQLVVNASPATHAQIEKLIGQIDKPLRNLLISVRNDASGESIGSSAGVSGGIRTGKVYLGANGPVSREGSRDGGLTVESNGVRVQTNREVRHLSTEQSQQIRVLEGTPSWISTGQSAPYRSYDRYGNPTTEYANANQGFYVTARVVGERVQLDISTSNDKFSDTRRGVIDTQQLQTSISGHIGEWIRLGGISSESNETRNGYTVHRSTDSSGIGDISIRVVPAE